MSKKKDEPKEIKCSVCGEEKECELIYDPYLFDVCHRRVEKYYCTECYERRRDEI